MPSMGVAGHALFSLYICNSKSKADRRDLISALPIYVQCMLTSGVTNTPADPAVQGGDTLGGRLGDFSSYFNGTFLQEQLYD